MIIGISGKKTVGKDTVGSIIQFLTRTGCEHIQTYNDWKTVEKTTSAYTTFQNKKFADKLKDIVCILIGCSREDLEDEEFKNTLLGEEYDRYGVLYTEGHMTANDYFHVTEWEYFNTKAEAEEFSKSKKDNVDRVELIRMTPRKMLQLLGTQGFRRTIHENIWVNSLMREYKNNKQGNLPKWTITDVRFKNEVEAIEKRGGITIRVNRPCNTCGGSGYHKMSCPVSKSGEHYSEIALDSAAFDYVVNNDSDIESLIEKVKIILEKENIL